jgi:MinD superfamily P-loop ATPase
MTQAPESADRRLDGNAAAGVLREVLAVDPTTAMSTCAHCGKAAPLGAHLVYADAPAMVIRCPGCMQVVIRCASDAAGMRLEMTGVRLLWMPSAGDSSS